MERFSDIIKGYCTLRLKGAEPAVFLDLCANEGREFWGVYPEDEFTFILKMRLSDVEELPRLAEKSFCEVELLKKQGGKHTVKRARHRIILWVLPLAFLALLVFASFFIWRIEIVGNEKLSETEILHALDDSGVYIGASWVNFNAEIIRSEVQAILPELKGLSFSVFGSRVIVEVREGEEIPKLFDNRAYSHVIADRAGIIKSMNALNGESKFALGRTVVGEDILISGVVESLIGDTRLVHAHGEVQARTWYEISAILPMEYTKKEYTGGVKSKFALNFGDNRINFYSKSRILEATCDSIIKEYVLGIGDSFSLPVSLVHEKSLEYDAVTAQYTETEVAIRLEEMLTKALHDSIGKTGEVVSAQFSVDITEGTAVGTLRAECVEDIAKEIPVTQAEIDAVYRANLAKDEDDDRENNGR